MEFLITEVRKLIYTIICFQCLLQLTEGSAYQKYLKLFSYLLTMCICCSVVVNFVNQVEESLDDADRLYAEWEEEWLKITSGKEMDIEEEYSRQRLWEEQIMDEAYKEYDSQKGEEENVEENSSGTFSQTAGDG